MVARMRIANFAIFNQNRRFFLGNGTR